jgi:hypothetical protein
MAATIRPSRTIITSFQAHSPLGAASAADNGLTAYDKGDWVLNLAVNTHNGEHTSSQLACALSNGDVHVYDSSTLQRLQCFRPSHNQGIVRDLQFAPHGSDSLLVTVGPAGLTVWDTRQVSAPALHSPLPTASSIYSTSASHDAFSLSIGYNGTVTAVGGTLGRIHFADWRNPHCWLGTYTQSHMQEDIVQVQFYSTDSQVLLTAGSEGLACVFDTSQPTEEMALQTVINVSSPLRRVGWAGDRHVWAMTTNEDLTWWDAVAGTRVYSHNNNSLFTINSQGEPEHWLRQHGMQQVASPMDYLVDAQWQECSQTLCVMAGNNQGEASIMSYSPANNVWKAHCRMQYGHHGVVRAWEYANSNKSALWTVGEDARICEWTMNDADSSTVQTTVGNMQPTINDARRNKAPAAKSRIKNRSAAQPY